MPLPPDIERFIDDAFDNPERVKSSISILSGFLGPGHNDHDDRIRRCVLFLSKDNAKLLRGYIKDAWRDWRNVIWWAEYDGGEKQLRDFTRPFEQSDLGQADELP